ncbi:hypothetical protein BDR07DRAFT_1378928 [Suillus spraguei]|nr:hypothetical protein BDR07DRAFT_1378912 [Suillus spraguei]KAG2359127.1 hypothetical protein BDR07DRAFT_1378928 [Suillus spraguei]
MTLSRAPRYNASSNSCNNSTRSAASRVATAQSKVVKYEDDSKNAMIRWGVEPMAKGFDGMRYLMRVMHSGEVENDATDERYSENKIGNTKPKVLECIHLVARLFGPPHEEHKRGTDLAVNMVPAKSFCEKFDSRCVCLTEKVDLQAWILVHATTLVGKNELIFGAIAQRVDESHSEEMTLTESNVRKPWMT